MPRVYDKLYELLQGLCPELAAVEYHFEGRLPDTILIYYVVDVAPRGHFSNKYHRLKQQIGVDILTRQGESLDALSDSVREILQANGFLFIDTDNDTLLNDTKHYKRTLNFNYYTEV